MKLLLTLIILFSLYRLRPKKAPQIGTTKWGWMLVGIEGESVRVQSVHNTDYEMYLTFRDFESGNFDPYIISKGTNGRDCKTI